MIFGYCRISKRTQNIQRQIENILKEYPDAKIIQETFTGTKIQGRKEFEKLRKIVQYGDTIIFDSVSRMSRNAEEGFEQYIKWYEEGINIVFLKEPYINTDTYKKSLDIKIPLTGNDFDEILIGINSYLKKLAKQQIRIAFDQAQKEVDDLHERTKEGMRIAKLNGKQIGQPKGSVYHVKKADKAKKDIKKYSRDFYGSNTDKEVMKLIGISHNTYYKYKRELLE